jgi:hypothetical protein
MHMWLPRQCVFVPCVHHAVVVDKAAKNVQDARLPEALTQCVHTDDGKEVSGPGDPATHGVASEQGSGPSRNHQHTISQEGIPPDGSLQARSDGHIEIIGPPLGDGATGVVLDARYVG